MVDARKPGKSRILVKIDDTIEQQTSSGIFLAPAHTTIKYGTILSLGECSFTITVGDKVCMMNGSGIEIAPSELILHESEILYTF